MTSATNRNALGAGTVIIFHKKFFKTERFGHKDFKYRFLLNLTPGGRNSILFADALP